MRIAYRKTRNDEYSYVICKGIDMLFIVKQSMLSKVHWIGYTIYTDTNMLTPTIEYSKQLTGFEFPQRHEKHYYVNKKTFDYLFNILRKIRYNTSKISNFYNLILDNLVEIN